MFRDKLCAGRLLEQQRRHHNLNIRTVKDLLITKYVFCMNFCNIYENLKIKDYGFIVINSLKCDAWVRYCLRIMCERTSAVSQIYEFCERGNKPFKV